MVKKLLRPDGRVAADDDPGEGPVCESGAPSPAKTGSGVTLFRIHNSESRIQNIRYLELDF